LKAQRSHSFLRFHSRSVSSKRTSENDFSQKSSSRKFQNDFRQEKGGQTVPRHRKGFENQATSKKQQNYQQASKKTKKYNHLLQVMSSEEKVIFPSLLKIFLPVLNRE